MMHPCDVEHNIAMSAVEHIDVCDTDTGDNYAWLTLLAYIRHRHIVSSRHANMTGGF